MTDRDYNHSRPLDVHRSSNYSEVNPFIDEIYNNHIKDVSENANIQKKLKTNIKLFSSLPHIISGMPQRVITFTIKKFF